MGSYHLASPSQQMNAYPQRTPDYMQQPPYNHSPYPQPPVDNSMYSQSMYPSRQYPDHTTQVNNYPIPQNYSPNAYPAMNPYHSPQNMTGYFPMQNNQPTIPQKRIDGGTTITVIPAKRPKRELNEEQKQGKSLLRRWRDVRFAGIEVGLIDFVCFVVYPMN